MEFIPGMTLHKHPQNGLKRASEEQAGTSTNLSTDMRNRYEKQCNANANANVKEEATVTPSLRSGVVTTASSTPGDDQSEYIYSSPLRRNSQFCADLEKSHTVSAKM